MKQIPMLDLNKEYEYMKKDIDHAIQNCLKHQKWIFGPEIEKFEMAAGKYLSVKHCIGVSSGTDALVLSLRALAIKLKGKEYFDRQDEIITTPFTFTATGDAILRSGATPVFIDINPVNYNIDTKKIKEYLSSKPSQAVGIIPVHLYGQSCNMDEIMDIARMYNLFVIEDVAQAFGAMWHNRKLGTIGNCGAFSFFPSKNLGAFGDAGMVTTNDDEVAELIRMLVKHGGKDKYNVDHIGYNARLDTLQASILLAKLNYIDEFNARRRQIAEIYTRELSRVEAITLPLISNSLSKDNSHHVFHQYTIRTHRRDELRSILEKKGVSTLIYYPYPLHKMKVFEGRMKTFGCLTNAEQACREVLSLPIGPLQNEEDTIYVVDCIKEFFT